MRVGIDSENSAVRPLCANDTKGLSPFGVFETVHGELIPVSEEERHAQTERVDLPEDSREDDQMEEEDVVESPVITGKKSTKRAQ